MTKLPAWIFILTLGSLACGMTTLPARPLPAALAAPVPVSVEFTENHGTFYVTAIEALTVRNRPSLDGDEIAWLVNGQSVTVYKCEWNYVDRVEWCDIGAGWVARHYLR